ncbi:MAG: hypothetical protein ACYTFG_03620 [Planctomycetota bacterium]
MSPEDTTGYRLKLLIWKPKYELDLTDQRSLQRSFYLNGVNGKFPGTDKGKHKVMGHCMVAVERTGHGILPGQLCFGKTSPDGPVEDGWAKAMKLNYGRFWQAVYALWTNVVGPCPRFRTPESPPGGVQTLFAVRNPSRYETRAEFEDNLNLASSSFSREISPEQAQRVMGWVNDSPCRQLGDPRGPAYGFGTACCDWAVGAAESIGAIDSGAPVPLRTRLFIHDAYWDSAGEMTETVWSRTQGGPYRNYVDIITPTTLIEAMAAQPLWARDPVPD